MPDYFDYSREQVEQNPGPRKDPWNWGCIVSLVVLGAGAAWLVWRLLNPPNAS